MLIPATIHHFAPLELQVLQPRILLVSTSYPVRQNSSSGIFVYRLAQALNTYFRVRVLAPSDSTPVPATQSQTPPLVLFRYAPYKYQVLAHAPGGIPAAIAEKRWLSGLLIFPFILAMGISMFRESRRCQLILANWSVCGAIAGIVGNITGKPVATVLRGADVNRAQYSLPHRLVLWLCLRLSRKVVSVSEAIAETVVLLFPRLGHKVVTIPNGVDTPQNIAIGAKSDGKALRLVFVGSLITRKRVDLILAAIKDFDCSVTLEIVGDGPLADNLRELRHTSHLDSRVRFHGAFSPERVLGFISACDALVLPSESEGRANVILEAFAVGLPVIATDIPGTRELVSDGLNGYLFPSGDAEALRQCISRLRSPEERKRLGTGARRFIEEEKLNWDSTASAYRSLLTEIIAASKKTT